MKAIIPVAGSGTRLRPLTYSKPKALLHVGSKPIIAHIVDSIIPLGCDSIILIISSNGDVITRYLEEHYHGFSCDGMVFHDAKTCPNNSNTRYGLPERLRANSGIATLTINGDLNDLRCYSEEQTITNIEAFVEQLAGD